ncbi:hypothetical protein D3C80_1074520 [compost metagenome]
MFQVVEKRRFIAFCNALQQAQVDLQRLLDFVEHPADERVVFITGNSLNLTIAEQQDIELRPDGLDRSGQWQGQVRGVFVVRAVAQVWGQQLTHPGGATARCKSETFVDHDRLQVDVEYHREQRILKGAGHDGLVDEGVLVAAQLANGLKVLRPCRDWRGADNQCFEIRTMCGRSGETTGRGCVGQVFAGLPVVCVLLVTAVEQRTADALSQMQGSDAIARCYAFDQQGQQARARVGLVSLQLRKLLELGKALLLDLRASGLIFAVAPAATQGVELTPQVNAGSGTGKQLIDWLCVAIG